jgi:rubrerythrin
MSVAFYVLFAYRYLSPYTAGKIKRCAERRLVMPDFGSPFSGVAYDRNLTDEELIRAIRFMVAAEYEAIQMYMQLAESTDNKLVAEVLKDIADEERIHVGEFLRLLRELAPDEEKFYSEGAAEVEEEIAKHRKA